jgi:alpha-tubulin suppressor-like RCC1 family protein
LKIINRGWGYQGQLGHNTKRHLLTPKRVDALSDEVIVDVTCGEYHTSAVTSTGSIFTWGNSLFMGHVPLPRLLQDLSSKGVVSVSADRRHAACVTKAGEVFTWGNGEGGILGHGDEIDQHTPKRVEALVGVKTTLVSCGKFQTAICTEDGRICTFGEGEYGQLGHGDQENKTSPALVHALVGKHITQVQCGDYHTMALTSSGYVFIWGLVGEDGALGHDHNSNFFSFPFLVEGLREHNVVQITTCSQHCAVLVDPTSPSSTRQSQEASFNNKQDSDVVFRVENESIYANVGVLSQKSDYFAAMFRSNMRESIERVVSVSHCSKAAFLQVLEYLYLDGFTVRIDDAVELWDLADFYQLEGLKYSCRSALERGLCEENVSQILQEAEDLSCPCDKLKRMCHEYLELHAEDSMDEDTEEDSMDEDAEEDSMDEDEEEDSINEDYRTNGCYYE